MHAMITNATEALQAACRCYDVARLEVVGSAARGTDFDPEASDADFLVTFQPHSALSPFDRYFGLTAALEHVLNRRVDLIDPERVRNPYIRAAFDQARELVYEA